MSKKQHCTSKCQHATPFYLNKKPGILCEKYHLGLEEGDACPDIIKSINIDGIEIQVEKND